MEKTIYLEKMDTILENPAKFQRIQKDPSDDLKINSLIQQANRTTKHFNKAIGDFRPGYCYGTVKTHKPGRSVSSVTEFIDLLRTAPPCQDIASLDVESLFTNVPVDETIDIILNRVYRSNRSIIDIPEDVLKSMLETCTKEAPFLSHRGKLFRQVDGVAMGSPLEPSINIQQAGDLMLPSARPQEHLAHQRSHRQLDPEPPQEHNGCKDPQQHQYPHHTGPRTRS
ncbi:uncharacterized protein LOC143036175 [Oratosquilla oratoria]|uniref:uncharacterized protein LOC143036175 n=1 Tax=Oratosquilla oratoria TaxID=337810 RepID=UPI003F7706B7